jgi:solute carrier family 25 carnitine/acylcarnitine transporter 20/29
VRDEPVERVERGVQLIRVQAIKTKAQQRALSGLEPRTPLVQFMRLVRGPDKDNPKPLLRGIARLYRG